MRDVYACVYLCACVYVMCVCIVYAGLHCRSGNKDMRLQQKVWLANKIVGRAVSEKVVPATSTNVRAYEGMLCVYVYKNICVMG